ncbi:family 15 carbohydrate-binding domain-containing protein [Marinimicrobium locisalis]|uniref:family 15 carbohydrate-binding domain-containing protein n=1 Tax=Marinimicrobium locisalis TaxID=546022 RepID=UPI003221D4B6
MLQKLLIALCTIFVLSACGGDLDLGPNQAPPEDTNGEDGGDDGGDGEDGGDDFEPGEPRIHTYIPFDNEEDTAGWASRCVETCDATATLSWNSDEEVLAAEPLWASDSDQLEVFGSVEEINDMAGSAASIWVYVTEDYVTDGNMSMHLLLGNAEGLKGVSRAYAPDLGWNRIEMWELAAGTGETTTDDEGNESTDYGTFLWHDDGFTLRNINEVGVRFAANGKATEVDGQLWLDNVTLTPASGTGPLIVEADDEGWNVMDATEEVTLQRDGEGGVYYEPTAADQKLVYLLDGPADLVGRSFDITFTVDQAFIDSEAAVQVIMQQNFGSYEGEWGCDYVGSASLTAGEPVESTCSTENEGFVAEEGQNIRLGVQVKNNPAGRVTITGMQVNINAGGSSGPETIEASMAEGWRVSADSLNLQYTEEGVAYSPSPDAEYNQLVYDISGPKDLSGASYEVVFSVDQDFKDGGKAVQPFIQRTDDYGIADYNCYVGNGELTAGEDYTASCPAINEDFNLETEEAGVQVGVQTAGDGTNQGVITVKSLTVTLD